MISGGILGIIGSLMNATAKDINTILGGTVFIGLAGAVQVSFRYIYLESISTLTNAS